MKRWALIFTAVLLPVGAAAQEQGTDDMAARGAYLATAGDCVACHTRDGGAPFAGGRELETPFGTLLSANITPSPDGIGNWSSDQFYRALHEGIDARGRHLYPAFPYNYFTHITRADSDALFAYFKSLKPAPTPPGENHLMFPFNIRPLMFFWNLLFLDKSTFRADPTRGPEWNRGAYLVEVLEHCGACHTPKNVLGAPKQNRALRGGAFAGYFAPDLTPAKRTGLGGWSKDEIVEFLKTGRNAHANAAAEMGEVVTDSTTLLTDADLNAIAAYLTALPPAPDSAAAAPEAGVMTRGAVIFADACAACHQADAKGVAVTFPPLAGSANLQQRDPTTVLHFILRGARSAATDARPTPFTMPAFDWKLSDEDIAAVATYVRNSWGNTAPAVRPRDVAKLRKKLKADAPEGSQPQANAR